MNVCFLQIETLNNKAREEGGESQKRRAGYGFIYCPNHAKHETGIYNPDLRDGERESQKRSQIGRDRERSVNEAKVGRERLRVGDERRKRLESKGRKDQ